MPEEPLVTVPLVHVLLGEDEKDPAFTRIRYFVGDEVIMDLSVEKEYVPVRPDFFPEMVLTQLLVTPHPHLALLGEFAAVCASINPENVPLPPDRWEQLLSRTHQLLNPPSLEDADGVIQG
jgi:hypothetical protein